MFAWGIGKVFEHAEARWLKIAAQLPEAVSNVRVNNRFAAQNSRLPTMQSWFELNGIKFKFKYHRPKKYRGPATQAARGMID